MEIQPRKGSKDNEFVWLAIAIVVLIVGLFILFFSHASN